MYKKYLKYKLKYLQIKGGTNNTKDDINDDEYDEYNDIYANPEKMNNMIELLNNKNDYDELSVKLEKDKLKELQDYISPEQFLEFANIPQKLIIDCKYKANMRNFFGICWFTAITMTFFFSDTTRVKAQQNLLPMIINIKNNTLSENQNKLLKIIYSKDRYYENGQLKKEIMNTLYLLFLNLYKNLFFMLQCKIGTKDSCHIDIKKCHLDIVSEFVELFPYEFNYKENDSIMQKNIKRIIKILNINPNAKYEDIGHMPLSQYNNMFLKYINLYCIILLDSIIIHHEIKIIETYQLIPNENIIGYLIYKSNHIFCIFKCNNNYYKCDNSNIIEYDIKKISSDYKDYEIISLNMCNLNNKNIIKCIRENNNILTETNLSICINLYLDILIECIKNNNSTLNDRLHEFQSLKLIFDNINKSNFINFYRYLFKLTFNIAYFLFLIINVFNYLNDIYQINKLTQSDDFIEIKNKLINIFQTLNYNKDYNKMPHYDEEIKEYIIQIPENDLDDDFYYNNEFGLYEPKMKTNISDLLRNFITKNKKIILRKIRLELISDILPTTPILKLLITRDIDRYCNIVKKSSPDLLNISNNLANKIRTYFYKLINN